MSNLDKEMFRLNQQKEKTEQAQESLTTYMWEEYEITYHAAKEQELSEQLNVSDLKSRSRASATRSASLEMSMSMPLKIQECIGAL